ncbi:MAG: insulinase family protein [Anaerostipes sp.]|jgi:Zn-dependent M16 (insulinase) family peptidase|nr:insulinase family protein [Anaerostipes sp.]MDD3745188.1 insulinase family protein [Anaerostipes sp.]
MNSKYQLVTKEKLRELDGIGYLLEHKKTGARVVVVSNEDDNKVFQIGFRTPPKDDTGVPHILEHSVLCGSREFPLKDPFVELVKGSLNTFLNAMTYPDKTVYPVASQNDKDFFHLVHVYLDAVFYPNIYKNEKIMMQEGWHYSLENKDAPITYNGVVYNEMKGVFSSPDQQLARMIQKSLLEDTPYGKESGGDPEFITDLTQEQFLEFHSTYYHPSNSYIYIYGDMDVDEYLTFIDEHYLCDFEKKEVDSTWKDQKAFDQTKRVEEFYPVGEDGDEESGTYLSYNVIVGDSLDPKLYLAFQILERALFVAPGAPVKKALMEAGIGNDIESSYDNGIKQPVFSIVARDAKANQEELFVNVLEDTLKKIVEDGIDQRSLEAALNCFEFKYKEANFGRFPKGLMYGLQMYDSWLYDDKAPFIHIETNDTFKFLHEQLESKFFVDLIQTYLLDNTHKSIVILKPKKGLQNEKDAKVLEKLRAYKNSLSVEEIEQLVQKTKELKEYQELPTPKEALEKIPVLDIEDIQREVKPLSNEELTVAGTKVLWHKYFTNDICYLKLAFHVNDVPMKLVPYMSLLTEIFTSVDTKKRSYFELGNDINIETGGMASSMQVLPDGDDDYISLFYVKTKCFFEKVPKAFELMEEVLIESKLDDKKRLKEILGELYSGLKVEMTAAGHKTAANRAMSYFSNHAAYQETIQGITMFETIKRWYENFDDEADSIVSNLEAVCHYIFRKENLIISFTGKEKSPQILEDSLVQFENKLYEDILEKKDTTVALKPKNEGYSTAGSVQYVATAGNYKKHGFKETGALRVLQVIFSYEYLWMNVRVKGGAYGCMCSFGPNGDSMLVSYRDPNLEKTYDVYEGAGEYLKNFTVDDRDMKKYIIGTISNMDTPLEADAMGARSFQAYLMKKTEKDLQKNRDDVLQCSQQDIRDLAPLVQSIVDDHYICTIGNEEKLKNQKEMFQAIKNIF